MVTHQEVNSLILLFLSCSSHPVFQVCVSFSQYSHQDPVYVTPGARGAQREGAAAPSTPATFAAHIPSQNQHSHNAAA